jgi:hypothetical protein
MNGAKRPKGNGGESWWKGRLSVWTERKRRGDISALGAQRTALVGAGLLHNSAQIVRERASSVPLAV